MAQCELIWLCLVSHHLPRSNPKHFSTPTSVVSTLGPTTFSTNHLSVNGCSSGSCPRISFTQSMPWLRGVSPNSVMGRRLLIEVKIFAASQWLSVGGQVE